MSEIKSSWWRKFLFAGRRDALSLQHQRLPWSDVSGEVCPPMLTDGLHCRLLALTHGDFDSVARATRQFGKPAIGFDQSVSIIAWDEFLSYQASDWSWAAGIPPTPIKLRIAVFHLGSLPPSVGVFSIISGFSSLSNATRSYIARPFKTNETSLQIDFHSIITDHNAQTSIVGYSYTHNAILHTLSNTSENTLTQIAPPLPSSATLNSICFKASSAIADVHKNLDITLTAEAGDADYAIEDSRAIFGIIKPHLKVLRP